MARIFRFLRVASDVCLRVIRNPMSVKSMELLNRSLLCLTIAVLLAALHRHFWTDADDPYMCGALLNTGEWLDGPSYNSQRQLTQWQPRACMLHEYKAEEIADCIGGKQIRFIGDSTIRQIFWATARRLNRIDADMASLNAANHSDMTYMAKGVRLEFIWDPFLNRTQSFPASETSMVLLGGGLWFAKHIENGWLTQYRSAMERIIKVFSEIRSENGTRKEHADLRPFKTSLNLFVAPVQEPCYDLLSPARRAWITPDKVHEMNAYLGHLSKSLGTPVLWSYAPMTQEKTAYNGDGLHVSEAVADRRADVLLNLECNAQLAQQGIYPNDGTCCSRYRRPNRIQHAVLILALGVLPVTVVLGARGLLVR